MRYALVRYRVYSTLPNDVEDNATSKVLELRCADFRDVGQVAMPFKVEASIQQRKSGEHTVPWLSKVLEVSEYVLADPGNTRDALQMVWPVGTTVVDTRFNALVGIGTEAKPLSDDMLRSATRIPPHISGNTNTPIEARPDDAKPIRLLVIVNCVAGLIMLLAWLLVRRRQKYNGPS
jgi:hypothetical protein